MGPKCRSSSKLGVVRVLSEKAQCFDSDVNFLVASPLVWEQMAWLPV